MIIYVKARDLAEKQGWTAAQLARKADLSYPTVQALWEDPTSTTNTYVLGRLAKALGVPAQELIESVPESKAV